MLKLTANRETLTELPNKQNLPERWKLDFSILPMNLSWTERVLLLHAETTQGQLIVEIQSLQAILNDHVKIGPVTRIEVFEYLQNFGFRSTSTATTPGNLNSWVCISRASEQYARLCIPKETEHKNSGAVLSFQSSSCGRPRAQTQGVQSPARYKTAPKPKLVPIGFSQRNWKICQAKTKHKRVCEFRHMSKHFTRLLRHGSCHEAHGAVRW